MLRDVVGHTLLFVGLAGCAPSDIPLNVRYPGPWREDFNLNISKALGAKSVSGCGQYKFRESSRDSGEYLVYCTRDGASWVSYVVWTKTGAVLGPNSPDGSL